MPPEEWEGGLSIRTWKIALFLGLGVLAVLIFVLLQLPNNEAGPPPPQSATYIDNADCVLPGCHQPINATFNIDGQVIARKAGLMNAGQIVAWTRQALAAKAA